MLRPYRCFRWLIACAIAPAALWIAPPGCGLAGDLSNFTASLGGDTAGQRGAVGVLFINNTPFRALLTAGTFDPDDRGTRPDFVQFSADPAVGTLETNNQSAIVPLACGRVFSVGGTRLLDAIERNLPDANVDPDATLTGVGFSGAAPGDDRAGESTEGEAPPLDARIGADFPCNALLIVRLEVNDAGPDPFRVDFSFIPSKSDR